MTWTTLHLRNLSVAYGSRGVLTTLNASFVRGHVYAVLGANGVGKSTLLRAIGGLIPYQGEVLPPLDCDDWRDGRGVSISIIEDLGLYDGLSVSAALRRTAWGRSYTTPSNDAYGELLARVTACAGLDPTAKLGRLSGGQRNLVSLALALVPTAPVLLTDEPLTGLDNKAASWVINELTNHASAGGLVIMTHNGDTNLLPAAWTRIALIRTPEGISMLSGNELTMDSATGPQTPLPGTDPRVT